MGSVWRTRAVRALGIIAACMMQIGAALPAPVAAGPDDVTQLRATDFESVGDIVSAESAAGRIPGAVIEIGQADKVVFRRAFGFSEREPQRVAMTPGTIFDLASLTKPVATSIAIMQLYEQGKISLDAPAAKYWPRFARNGKASITVRELMTHYSGLRADLDLRRRWSGYGTALQLIEGQTPVYPPGARYVYSDINFEVLGELVRRVSGLPLDVYCRRQIFGPLGMRDTGFAPRTSARGAIAPTEYLDGAVRIGQVNDPTAARMGGVAGHAGLFSTADDLAIFARMLLNGGRSSDVRILTSRSVDEMSMPESPQPEGHFRGLGWDLAAPLASNRSELPAIGSYGHTGFTGTMLWIDPISGVYVIVLTNRTYPDGSGDARPLRRKILTLVSARIGAVSLDQVAASRPTLGAFFARNPRLVDHHVNRVMTGADVIAADGFAELRGLRIGLITNQSGVNRAGLSDVEALSDAPGLKLAAIFTPEHGLYGDVDGLVDSGFELTTGRPLYSLYGETTRPGGATLRDIDALVFDVQDSGARFYTYATTMAYAMEAAARHGIPFYVLDRPNPISGDVVQGPVMDANLESFTGYFPLPTRHGMTLGELAELFNHENRIGACLRVIRMRGYHRDDWYDQSGLEWIAPSPNLRTLVEAALYPGVGMVEGANVSVGRGTATPFEVVGAPWIDARRLHAYLKGRNLGGVHFEPITFTPTADRYASQLCHGVRIVLDDRNALDSPALGVELIAALYRLQPRDFRVGATLGMVGSARVIEEIKSGDGVASITARWRPALERFRQLRAKYLLY